MENGYKRSKYKWKIFKEGFFNAHLNFTIVHTRLCVGVQVLGIHINKRER